ncbi:glycoside hydrolase family 11 protein [Algibacillus agarilyticus]|uniref:glycoside hydrolase family 11 protein n=1 Tax=Algibacillus agarilyticus TaxID=2234133 RepID=UPI000DCF81E1|nr:glycoside hydrolase family 11 protein [Algibacillus agarilyticus]
MIKNKTTIQQVSYKCAASLALAATVCMSLNMAHAGETFQNSEARYPNTEQGYFTSHYELNNDPNTYLYTTSYTASYIHMTGSSQNVVSGRGWQTGHQWRKVNFSINNYNPDDNGQKSVFALYGWTKSNNTNYDGMAEYYIMDKYNGWYPEHQNDDGRDNGARWLGSKNVDNARYDYYVSTRTNKPHAYGAGGTTFKQYWAVRDYNNQRDSGEINVGQHFQMWKNPQEYKHEAYPYIGNWHYQIFGIELIGGGGSVNLNAWSTN